MENVATGIDGFDFTFTGGACVHMFYLTDGKPEIDPHGSDIARFHEHQKARHHVKARSAEGFRPSSIGV